MNYLWIFVGCYAFAFILINLRMSAQTARAKTYLKASGLSVEGFDAARRVEVSLSKEVLIRVWAPFVYCVIPALILCVGYFIFS